jgi:hypothetical protein
MENTEPRKHFFDLKIPLGSLLGFYGLLLLLYGIFGPSDIYSKSFQIDVNAIWGALMMVIASVFLISAYAGRKTK